MDLIVILMICVVVCVLWWVLTQWVSRWLIRWLQARHDAMKNELRGGDQTEGHSSND